MDRTTLSNIIQTSTLIADRVNFIAGLDALIFDTLSKQQLLERRQLHRILAQETWIFGENWALTGDDDRLTRVLVKYLHFLGREDDVEVRTMKPALSVSGGVVIPDLVLSRTLESSENKYEHLVVELKRPNHTLKSSDVDQIREYAEAVANDERWDQPNTYWDYVLVGNQVHTTVESNRRQRGLPFGVIQESEKYRLWVRTWAEIIGDAKHRLKYVQDSLEYAADHDQGVEHLQERHSTYLPNALLEPKSPKDGDTADGEARSA